MQQTHSGEHENNTAKHSNGGALYRSCDVPIQRKGSSPPVAVRGGPGPSWSSPLLDRLNSLFDFTGPPITQGASPPTLQEMGSSYPPMTRRASQPAEMRPRRRSDEEKESLSPGKRREDREQR